MPAFGPNTPVLDSFLAVIVDSIRSKNGQRITELIQLDFDSLPPEQRTLYADLNGELNRTYPPEKDGELSARCQRDLSQDEFGLFSITFSDSIVQYFRYLRDFTSADNQAKASKIRQLTSQCVIALGDSKYGVIMIPIVLSFSRTLATIATNLDRNPSLVRSNDLLTTQNTEGAPGKVSFVEDAANVLRDAFIKCLAGSPGVPRISRPAAEDKRVGIYLTADSCLKLLTQCRKLRNAQQMFSSIDAQSPPLAYYPAAQRVTYLYYLGRYHFANNHFMRAQTALQAAYEQCHRQAVKHKRSILTYLISANLCLGRFPSSTLLARPEAAELGPRFLPLCQIMRSGNLGQFYQYLALDSESGQWFVRRSILLQLRNRCEIIVWRSLIRKTFLFSGYMGEEKKVPFLRLHYVRHAAAWAIKQQTARSRANGFGSHTMNAAESYVDPEFADMDGAINETGFDMESGEYLDDYIGQHEPAGEDDSEESPTMTEVESVVLSLIQQGFLRGFALHTNPRFAIPGSQKAGGPMRAGFPEVWKVIKSKEGGEPVPGWVEEGNLGSGGSNVVRISGARPAGA